MSTSKQRGGGTMAANRAMNSTGCITRCVRRPLGYLVRYATDPSRKMLSRSLAIAGRKP